MAQALLPVRRCYGNPLKTWLYHAIAPVKANRHTSANRKAGRSLNLIVVSISRIYFLKRSSKAFRASLGRAAGASGEVLVA